MRSDLMKQLLSEFPELLAPDTNYQKEVFAHFGLLHSKIALCEHSLINISCDIFQYRDLNNKLIKNPNDWVLNYEKNEKYIFSLTYGKLAKIVIQELEFSNIVDEIEKSTKLRNYFTHKFLRTEFLYFESDEKCLLLIEKIFEFQLFFKKLDLFLSESHFKMRKRFRFPELTDAHLASEMNVVKSEFETKFASGEIQFGWETDAL